MKDGSDSANTRQTAFEQSAHALGFKLSHTSFEVGEHTDIGLLLGPLASPVLGFEKPEGYDEGLDELKKNIQIVKLIQNWEKASPDELSSHVSDYVTDPFLLVGSDGIGQVSHSDFVSGAEQMKKYPLHAPRKVTLGKEKVIHLGGGRAAITYTFEEEFTDGTSIHSNAVALAVRLDVGWRIALATDHLAS